MCFVVYYFNRVVHLEDEQPEKEIDLSTLIEIMEFSNGEYKIRKVFA